MKKNSQRILLAFILVLLSILAFVLASCLKKEVKNADSGGKNIICFGDSITFGYGVKPGEDYPANLARLLNMPVINAGVDGDTSAQGLQRIKTDVLDREPYLVLIEFTGNDFLKKVPLHITIDNMREMIRQVQDAGAMAAIVDISAGLFLIDYRIKLANLARETRSIFIPAALTGIITNPSMKSDFMHPNAAGYTIVSEKVYLGIKDYLR